MNDKNRAEAFFEEPFAKDYINCTEQLIRRTVTGISASCEVLGSMMKKKDRGGRELIDGIMTMCCDLMRSAELSSALSAGSEEQGSAVVRLDLFVRDFAEKCREVSRERCEIRTGEIPPVFVKTDRDMLRYLLLSYIRRTLTSSESGKAAFELKCGETDKNVIMELRALGTFVDGAVISVPDVFALYPVEVCSGLAARAGASAELSEEGLSVRIPQIDGNTGADVKAPAPEFNRGIFEPFNIMLRDV